MAWATTMPRSSMTFEATPRPPLDADRGDVVGPHGPCVSVPRVVLWSADADLAADTRAADAGRGRIAPSGDRVEHGRALRAGPSRVTAARYQSAVSHPARHRQRQDPVSARPAWAPCSRQPDQGPHGARRP